MSHAGQTPLKRISVLLALGLLGTEGGVPPDAPTVQATLLTVVDVTDTTQEIALVRGDGELLLVVSKNGGVVTAAPADGVFYSEGADLGGGNIVRYVGMAADFTATGLTANTDTYYKAWEFNANGALTTYLLTSPPVTNKFTFTAEYQVVLNYAVSQGWVPPVTLAGKFADNDLIKEAKTNGLWAAAPRFWNFHTTGDSDYACINYKSPGVGTCIKVNSPTFTAKGGFATNGTSSVINTQFNPSTDGGSLATLNNTGYVMYSNTDGIQNGTDFGINGITQCATKITGSTINCRINGTTNYGPVSPANVTGLWVWRRISSTGVEISRAGTSIGTGGSNPTTSLPNNITGIGARRTASAFDSFVARRYDCFMVFQHTAATTANLNTMWTNHRTRTAAV